MAQTVDRATLLSYFERRKKPTQAQYADLINSVPLFAAEASSAQNALELDQITEKTAGNGVIISSVTMASGSVTAPNGFSTPSAVTAASASITNATIQALNAASLVTTVSIQTPSLTATNATIGTVSFGNLSQTTEQIGVSTTTVSFLASDLTISKLLTDGSIFASGVRSTSVEVSSSSVSSGITSSSKVEALGFVYNSNQTGTQGFRQSTYNSVIELTDLQSLSNISSTNKLEFKIAPNGISTQHREGANDRLSGPLWMSTKQFDVNDFSETSPGSGVWQADSNISQDNSSDSIHFSAVSHLNGAWYDVNRPSPSVQFDVSVSDAGFVSAKTTQDPSAVADDLFRVNVLIWHAVRQPAGT